MSYKTSYTCDGCDLSIHEQEVMDATFTSITLYNGDLLHWCINCTRHVVVNGRPNVQSCVDHRADRMQEERDVLARQLLETREHLARAVRGLKTIVKDVSDEYGFVVESIGEGVE